MHNDSQIQDLKNVIQRLREQNEVLSQNLDHANQLIISSQRQGTAFANEKQALEDRNSSLNNEKVALTTQVNALKQQNSNFNSEKLALEQQIATLTSERDALRERLEDFKSRLESEKDKLRIKAQEIINRQSELKIEEKRIADQLEVLTEKETDFNARNLSLLEKQSQFRTQKLDLDERAKAITVRETSLADQSKKLEDLIAENYQEKSTIQQLRDNLHSELSEIRQSEQAKLAEQLQQEKNKFAEQQQQEKNKFENQLQTHYDKSLATFNQEFASKAEKLTKGLEQLAEEKAKLETIQIGLDTRAELLVERENRFEDELRESIKLDCQRFDTQILELNQANDRLRGIVSSLENEKNIYADLESRLNGKNPHEVLAEIQTQKTLIHNLQKELIERPSKEVQDTLYLLENDKQNLLNENQKLRADNEATRALEEKCKTLEFERDVAESRKQESQAELEYQIGLINKLQEEIALLSKPFGAEKNREERINSLLTPPQIILDSVELYDKDRITEQEWLENIDKQCRASDFNFSKRILNAFHTSLKTGEFSPITVLAGVSGTGKSQLPALYSKFGGINFINVPVQPNWDSQEAMLGYFNSMTNHFDAQPVLKFLMQSQQDRTENYPNGLKYMMNLILLDEMNLSHPELYFAEFLSKLEERRGKTKVPSIDINLGSGIASHALPLRRNVLWVGTMNQDETTKSLSDKVIDRSFIINFPRPKELKSLNLKKMSDSLKIDKDYKLSYELWRSWIKNETLFAESEVKDYKTIIEDINNYLDKAGRALGHRVWQSVEYYMSNHPDVIVAHANNDEDKLRESMKTAFEDQLVQKVMPKLRGIETRGKADTNCLKPIQELLDDKGFKIVEDFKHAREVGHGQFIWSSAYYLEEEDTIIDMADKAHIDNVSATSSKTNVVNIKVNTKSVSEKTNSKNVSEKLVTPEQFDELTSNEQVHAEPNGHRDALLSAMRKKIAKDKGTKP